MDDSFGPRLLGHFDFTLLFEHTMFQMIPSAVVLFTLPFYIHKIATCRRLVRPGWLLWAKIAVAAALAAIQLASVVFWYKSPLNSKVAQAASILSFASYLGLGVVAYASHAHFLQPVLFLALYLSVTLLFDLVTVYTYWHRTGLGTIARLTCALPALKAALIVLEELSKRSLIIAEEVRNSLGQEGVAGFWNKSTFLWINPLLLFGFRHIITTDHLPDLGQRFDSERLHQAFKRQWESRNQNGKHALIKACVYSMPWPFFYVIPPRLLLSGFTFTQPFLLQDVVRVVSGEPTQEGYVFGRRECIALILATAIVFSGKAVSRNWFSHVKNEIMICMRGILVTAIYEKSLKITAKESDDSAAVTLMSTDVNGIERLISLVYDSCAMVLEVGLGIAILSLFVGMASIFTVVTATAVAVCSRYMAKQMRITRKRWNERIEDRIAATSNILAQIKDVKMMGLAPSMATHLQQLRAKEIEAALTDRRIVCITFGVSAFAETVTPAVVIAATLFWTRATHPISIARFYTTLAVVTMVAEPLATFFANLPQWSAGFACISRIEAYLAQPELSDPRQVIQMPADSPSHAAANDAPGLRNRYGGAAPGAYAVQLDGVNVTNDLTGSILRDATVYIKAGEITMLYGSVGCGKTTLLRVMLGEVLLRNGIARLSTSFIAFAGQKPWLLNTTIRLNIIGHKVYNHALYQKVVFICDLGVDFQQLPDGDQTVVGSGGCHLSGGQKQRISIARALYFEADITVLDDPFSSLDRETSALIRIRLISDGNATTDGRTLIMTTSMKQHLVDADSVFRVTEEGQVKYTPPERVNAELDELAQNTRSQNLPTVPRAWSTPDSSEPPAVQPSSVSDTPDRKENETYHGGFALYAYFFGPAGIPRVTAWLALICLAAVAEKLPNIFVRIWLDADPGNYLYYIGYAILCCAHPLLNSLSAIFFYYYVVPRAVNQLHQNLVDTTFRATFEFLINEDASSILNRFSQDISMATQRVPIFTLPTVFRGISVIIDTGIISAGASYAAPIIPFFLLLVFIVQKYYLRTSRQLRVLELDTSKSLVRHFTETAAGIEHIRAFRWQEDVIQDFHAILDSTQRPLYFLYCIQQWLEGVLDFSSAVAAVIVVTFALLFPSAASGNAMGLALLSLIGFSATISEWVQSSVAMETALGAVSRIQSYCSDTPLERYKDENAPVAQDWPVNGQLELNCVSAVYGHTTAAQFTPMNNATVIIRPGQTLGVVGRTGSGKTTILLSILNLLEYAGTISIDDREIRTIPPDLLRSRITTITQGGIHLRGSVKFNLDPFDPATRPPNFIVTEDMQQDVLRRVGLWDIISRRGSLTSRMKDMSFSHGQKQLFHIARAMLHQQVTGTKIVLMDEVTAGLDEETEQRISEVLAQAFTGCTKVVISHRVHTLDGAEAVMVLDAGRAHVARHTPGQSDWTQGI